MTRCGGKRRRSGTGLVTSFSGSNCATTARSNPRRRGPVVSAARWPCRAPGRPLSSVTRRTRPVWGARASTPDRRRGSAITSWAKTSTLTAPSGSDAFGTAVAITAAGTEALVGDPTGGRAPARPAVTAHLRARGPPLPPPLRSRPHPSRRTSAPRSPCPVTRRAPSWVTRMAPAPIPSRTVR